RSKGQSRLPWTEGMVDVAAWAAIWSMHVHAPPESVEYLALVDAWRDACRPRRVRLLLVAESHMGELGGDLGVRVRRPRSCTTEVPEGYCRLVHCFGYGEGELCEPRPRKNSGTLQYWDLFGEAAWGPGHQQPRRSAA